MKGELRERMKAHLQKRGIEIGDEGFIPVTPETNFELIQAIIQQSHETMDMLERHLADIAAIKALLVQISVIVNLNSHSTENRLVDEIDSKSVSTYFLNPKDTQDIIALAEQSYLQLLKNITARIREKPL